MQKNDPIKKYYYIRKGEFSGELAKKIEEDDSEITLKTLEGNTIKVPHHYCVKVPKLGDIVTLNAPLTLKVVERLKANQPFIRIEAWVRVDDVDILNKEEI